MILSISIYKNFKGEEHSKEHKKVKLQIMSEGATARKIRDWKEHWSTMATDFCLCKLIC